MGVYPSTDSWTRKAEFGGGPRIDAIGFSIGSKGYMSSYWLLKNPIQLSSSKQWIPSGTDLNTNVPDYIIKGTIIEIENFENENLPTYITS